MNSWANPPSLVERAVVCDDPAARTPYCTPYCVLFFGVRLHEIACDVANRRDPILEGPSRSAK